MFGELESSLLSEASVGSSDEDDLARGRRYVSGEVKLQCIMISHVDRGFLYAAGFARYRMVRTV